MESTAKVNTQCDNCKQPLRPKDDVMKENIQATLCNSQGEH